MTVWVGCGSVASTCCYAIGPSVHCLAVSVISFITGTESGEVLLDRLFGSGSHVSHLYNYSYIMMLLTDRMTHDSALLTKADLLLMDYLLIAD